MSQKTIRVNVFRLDPALDSEFWYQRYDVPFEEGLSAMDVLDYIYQNLDSTLAYYDHAGCSLGICGKCTARINGKPGLLCQTPVGDGDLILEPLKKDRVLKDLVVKKAKEKVAALAAPAGEGGTDMVQDINNVDLIVRREIEALIAVPLIKAYGESFGDKAARDVAQKVIGELAIEAGKMLKMFAGGDTMQHLQRAIPLFSQGGALEVDILEAGDTRAAVNVTRCKYAEMYREHGLEDFGYLLSCGRDFALMKGFNPKIKFTRTQTIMEGAAFCDFRFEVDE